MMSEDAWKEKVRRWIHLEKQRRSLWSELCKIRETQTSLEETIVSAIPAEQRREWKVSPSSGGTISFEESREYSRVTHKMLKECLFEFERSGKPWKAKDVFAFIMSKRTVRTDWIIVWKK